MDSVNSATEVSAQNTWCQGCILVLKSLQGEVRMGETVL